MKHKIIKPFIAVLLLCDFVMVEAAVFEIPLACEGQYNSGQEWTTQFDLGVAFRWIYNVYIDLSGTITAEKVTLCADSNSTWPVDGKFVVKLSGANACYVPAGAATYPNPEPFNVHLPLQECNYLSGELLVTFADSTLTIDEKNAILASYGGGTVTHSFTIVPGLSKVELPQNIMVEEAIEVLSKAPEILRVNPNYLVYTDPPIPWHWLFDGQGSITIWFDKILYRPLNWCTANNPIGHIDSATLVIEGRIIGETFLVPSQYPAIQEAIDKCFDGDTVLVADGTYTGLGNRDIDFLGKAITVKSENGPENCIIDCNDTYSDPNRGFYFHSGEDANSIVDGFTITNGHVKDGGGISCLGSSPTISNCIISRNTASAGRGGGIYCYQSSPKITGCKLSENSAYSYSGGIYCDEGSPMISNCTITGSELEFYGGGSGSIYCRNAEPIITNCTVSRNKGIGITFKFCNTAITNSTISENKGGIYSYSSTAIITDCVINQNTTENGAGIYCDYRNLTMANCIISGNLATSRAGGIFCRYGHQKITNCIFTGNSANNAGGILCFSTNLNITNCIFNANSSNTGNALTCNYPNMSHPSNVGIINCILADGGNEISNRDGSTITVTHSDVQGGWSGEGNIDVDPLFIEPGYWDPNGTPADANDDIWIEGDYHLLPGSPCINAGDPNYIPEPNETDLDGNPRINGGRIDMGAYETIQREAHLGIWPRVINRKNRQPRIMAWIHLPQGITKEQVDESEPLILYPGGIKATRQFVIQSRGRFYRRTYVFAFFNKAELMDALPENGLVELQALGYLLEPGQYFHGTDTVRIIAPRPFRRWPFSYWRW